MNPDLIEAIATAVSRSSITIAVVVVTGAIINSLTLIFLARERKSTVKVRDVSGQVTEMIVVDTKTIQEFTTGVRSALKSQKGDF